MYAIAPTVDLAVSKLQSDFIATVEVGSLHTLSRSDLSSFVLSLF